MLEIPPELYMVLFLSEDREPDGMRRKALPSHRREEDYEDRLEMFVKQNYPDLQAFSDRHECGLDFQSSLGESSAVLLHIRDDETLALLRLTFENDTTKIINFKQRYERERARHAALVEERQRQEYEAVKRRYFELKAIMEPDE